MPELGIFFGSIAQFFGCLGGILWVLMLIHCAKNSQLQRSKMMWFLLIFFTQWVGAAIYCCIYLVPRSFWGRVWQWFQASQVVNWSSSPYQPSQAQQPQQPRQPAEPYQPYQSYQFYQQGYKAQTPQYNQYQPSPAPIYIAQEEQTSSADYEQPQTMYPEMPPQEP